MYVVTQTRKVNSLIYVVTQAQKVNLHSYVVTQARKVNLLMYVVIQAGKVNLHSMWSHKHLLMYVEKLTYNRKVNLLM